MTTAAARDASARVPAPGRRPAAGRRHRRRPGRPGRRRAPGGPRACRASSSRPGTDVGAAMSQWGHIRTFTPWQYIVDATAEKLLAPTGWTRPAERQSPTGAEIVEQLPAPARGGPRRRGAHRRPGAWRSRARGWTAPAASAATSARSSSASSRADGTVEDLRARAVIDASGTWGQSNPLGASGLPALGEDAGRCGRVPRRPAAGRPGRRPGRFAGRTTLVVGMGHSAANTLVAPGPAGPRGPGHPHRVGHPRHQRAPRLRRRHGRPAARPRPARLRPAPTSSRPGRSSTSPGSPPASCALRRTAAP